MGPGVRGRWWTGGLAIALTVFGCGDNLVVEGNEVLYEGFVWGDNLAVSDGLVYFTTYYETSIAVNDTAVWAVPNRGGGAPSLVWRGGSHGIPGSGMVVTGDRVVWSGEIGDGSSAVGVFSVPVSGGERTILGELGRDGNGYGGVATAAGQIYAGGSAGLIRVPISGGATQRLDTGASSLVWIEIRDDTLYMTTLDGTLHRMDVTSSVFEPVATDFTRSGALSGRQFAIDHAVAYLGDDDGIVGVPLDGGDVIRLPVSFGRVFNVVKGPDALYAAVAGEGPRKLLVRVPLDGAAPTVLFEDEAGGVPLLVAEGRSVYMGYCCREPIPGAPTGGNGRVVRVDL